MRRADGTLLVEGVLTRTGVFVYRDAAGKERREYRPPDEVFKADSLDSFHLVPLTDDHPPELITAANAKQYAIGAVGAPRRDGAQMVAPLAVFDASVVAKVDGGKQELSCGYYADVVDEPGVSPEGERYDAIQRGICGNHLAIVDTARAGHAARIRMDGAAVMVTDTPAREARADSKEQNMKARIDGVEYEVSEQVAQAIAKKDAAQAEAFAAEKARADSAETTAAAEKARADGFAKDLEVEKKARQDAEDPAKIAERVRDRAELQDAARGILGKGTDFAKMSDREIQVAVVEKVDGDKLGADEHERYVKGRFDSARKRGESSAASMLAQGLIAPAFASRTDEVPDEEKAEAAMRERSANAWKQTEGK